MKRSSSCRLRKVSCPDCGYTIRMARSWMTVGLPVCPCGSRMEPAEDADKAYCGLIGPEDMPAPMWTAICRENGWEDSIQRKGAAAKAWNHRQLESGGILSRKVAPAEQCSYAGCGKWVKHGQERCAEHSHELAAAIPF